MPNESTGLFETHQEKWTSQPVCFDLKKQTQAKHSEELWYNDPEEITFTQEERNGFPQDQWFVKR